MQRYDITYGKAGDIEAIVQFQVDMAMESEGTTLDKEKVTRGVAHAMGDQGKGIYLVARDNGMPIGSLMLTKEWSDWNDTEYWWIQSVYVRPDYRGKGVYKALYSAVKEAAKAENITQIRLYVDKTNIRAQQVYQKLGMHECHYFMYEEELR